MEVSPLGGDVAGAIGRGFIATAWQTKEGLHASNIYFRKAVFNPVVHSRDQEAAYPSSSALLQNYLNPFNPRTTIKYDLRSAGWITLEVFNMLGQHVMTLVDGQQLPGTHEAIFDGMGLASGVYLYRVSSRSEDGKVYTEAKKLVLIK